MEESDLSISAAAQEPVGFAGFVLDRCAVEKGVPGVVLDVLDTYGLNPLLARRLTRAESRALRRAMRDERVPVPLDPGIFIPAVDLCPTAPARAHLREFPGLDNARLFKVIYACRKALRSQHPELSRRTLLEMSRNAEQAWQFVRAAMPGQESSLHDLVEARRRAFATPFPVLRRLSGGAGQERAKVEVVDFHGRRAVCKTFRPGQEHFLQREVEAIRELRGRIQEVPEVLASGENWLVMPLYEDSGRFQQRNWLGLLPLDASRELIQALEKLYEAGYAHLDMRRDNLIFDEQEGLKILDFEFAYRYSSPPPSFAESYDVVGCPAAVADEVGPHGVIPAANYANRVQHVVGLDFESLCRDPGWKQRLKRALYIPTGAVPRLARKWFIGKLRPMLRQLRREGTHRLRRVQGRATLHH